MCIRDSRIIRDLGVSRLRRVAGRTKALLNTPVDELLTTPVDELF